MSGKAEMNRQSQTIQGTTAHPEERLSRRAAFPQQPNFWLGVSCFERAEQSCCVAYWSLFYASYMHNRVNEHAKQTSKTLLLPLLGSIGKESPPALESHSLEWQTGSVKVGEVIAQTAAGIPRAGNTKTMPYHRVSRIPRMQSQNTVWSLFHLRP